MNKYKHNIFHVYMRRLAGYRICNRLTYMGKGLLLPSLVILQIIVSMLDTLHVVFRYKNLYSFITMHAATFSPSLAL